MKCLADYGMYFQKYIYWVTRSIEDFFSSIFDVSKIRKGLLNFIFQELYQILQKSTFKNLWQKMGGQTT